MIDGEIVILNSEFGHASVIFGGKAKKNYSALATF